MSVYYMNEGAFELPDAPFTDRTTHVVQVVEGGHELTLVITRLPLPAGKTLRQVAEGRVLEEMARLSGYAVTATREASWAGVPALEISARWRYEGRAIHQQQAHMALGGIWFYLAISTPSEGRDAADAWFDRIRETIRLRLEA